MYKWMYDRMVKEYEKASKEELVQRIMAMDEIECSDRCFANQCEAGTAISNINKLFYALDELQAEFSPEKVTRICEISNKAKDGWNYIVNGLSKMNDNSRGYAALENLKERINNAKDSMDSI